MDKRAADRRFRMFRAAAVACGSSWPEHAGQYRCPLCGAFFAEDQIGELSFDHAPPSSLPGRRRVVALTCRPCNSNAGESVDDAMLDQEELRAVRTMSMWQPRESIVPTPAGPVVTNTQLSSEGMAIFGVPKANRKDTQDAWIESFESQLVDGAGKITLSGSFMPRRPQRWAELGWLRSAYLIAFASGGYRYAFSPALEVVRHQLQIANRDRILIDKFAWRITDADIGSSEIVYIAEPDTFRSIAVRMGDVMVLLPVIGDMDLYSRLAVEPTDPRTLNLRIKSAPWPVPATYGIASRRNQSGRPTRPIELST